MTRLILALLSGWFITLHAAPAFASAQELFGFGSRSPGMAGGTVALSEGFEALYANPAGLAWTSRKSFAFGYTRTDMFLDARSGSGGVGDAARVDRPGGITFGTAVPLPLPGAWNHRFHLGIGLYIPDSVLIQARVPAPYEPGFPIVGNRANTLGIHAAGAVRITDWLRMGAGVKVLARLIGDIRISPNIVGQLSSSIVDELKSTWALLAGITLGPFEGVRVAAAYRGEEVGSFSLPIQTDLGEAFPIEVPTIRIRGVAQFDPRTVALASSWSPGSWLQTEASVTFKQWSRHPEPIETATQAAVAPPPISLEDTFSWRLSAESGGALHPLWRWEARIGYGFEPSPVPGQSGPSNHLDNDRHISAIGASFSRLFPSDEGESDRSITVHLFVQHHLLSPRRHVKDPSLSASSPGWVDNAGAPWIESSGQILTTGAGLEVAF